MRITSGGNVLMNCTGVPSGTSGGGAAFETTGTLNAIKTIKHQVQLQQKFTDIYNPNGEVGSISTSGTSTTQYLLLLIID
jgi:hypothetical protein